MNSKNRGDDKPQNHSKTPSENLWERRMTLMWLSFIFGVFLGTIPAILYVNRAEQREKSVFRYEPNNIVYKKPEYLQILQTEKDVQEIQDSGIKGAHLAEKGAAVERKRAIFTLISQEKLHSPQFHLKWIGSHNSQTSREKKFSFHANAILTQDPFVIQVLQTPKEVQFSQKQEEISHKNLLEIGAAIACSNQGEKSRCDAIGKSTLAQEYEKITPLSRLIQYYTPKS